ncbi:MAG TPA: hypothetical protein VMY87_02465 [Armatimonadota bacterium]|nr:hypothetical protein [Armatimonadota bacterium]
MKQSRRELVRTIAVVAVIWVVILVAVARWQGRGERAGAGRRPELMHYPGTEAVEEQHSANLGFRKYWFTLNEDYPSKSVYYFYRNELEPKGWTPLHRGEPRWVRQVAKKESRDVFQAVWGSPDNLFQIQLDMMSVVKPVREGEPLSGEEREPGIEVFVTLQRSLHPGLIMQPKAPTGRPGVEVEPGE